MSCERSPPWVAVSPSLVFCLHNILINNNNGYYFSCKSFAKSNLNNVHSTNQIEVICWTRRLEVKWLVQCHSRSQHPSKLDHRISWSVIRPQGHVRLKLWKISHFLTKIIHCIFFIGLSQRQHNYNHYFESTSSASLVYVFIVRTGFFFLPHTKCFLSASF